MQDHDDHDDHHDSSAGDPDVEHLIQQMERHQRRTPTPPDPTLVVDADEPRPIPGVATPLGFPTPEELFNRGAIPTEMVPTTEGQPPAAGTSLFGLDQLSDAETRALAAEVVTGPDWWDEVSERAVRAAQADAAREGRELSPVEAQERMQAAIWRNQAAQIAEAARMIAEEVTPAQIITLRYEHQEGKPDATYHAVCGNHAKRSQVVEVVSPYSVQDAIRMAKDAGFTLLDNGAFLCGACARELGFAH